MGAHAAAAGHDRPQRVCASPPTRLERHALARGVLQRQRGGDVLAQLKPAEGQGHAHSVPAAAAAAAGGWGNSGGRQGAAACPDRLLPPPSAPLGAGREQKAASGPRRGLRAAPWGRPALPAGAIDAAELTGT